ncbi:MAG: hypothetical protein CMN76_21075 [Spirochaetaceae bacterium]|nr:hypothetical protein [Spirochaetaceae bacterium]|tara:strand:+ start:46491 stop:47135 length:645 start_codon:yes stop_codon:yes gene_type:complete
MIPWNGTQKALRILILAAIVTGLTSSATCDNSPGQARELDFSESALADSRQQWQKTENELNGSYTYIRVQGSMTGETYVTLARFEKGELTARVYKRLKVGVKDGKRAVEVREAWMATNGMKRLFSGEGGFPGLSMAELYEYCEKEILHRDPEKNHVALAADERGVLKRCYYSPKLCADDCGKSYDVSHFYDKAVTDEVLKEYSENQAITLEEQK